MPEWQQETAAAVARRLLVASMACVLIWQLARSPAPEASRLRSLLIRLSGRQMKRGQEFTEPALLAGMWVLLAMLEILQQHGSRVDLLLSDVVMPKMGGRELAQGLRRKMPGLKVVLVSGYAGDPERTSGLEASQFVQKPFSMHHLASTVREVLDADNQNN